MTALKIAAIIVIGYLLGSIQFGVLIARQFGLRDIRKVGSGGSGATNVMRNLGKIPSLLTLVCDAVKGAVPALIGIALIGPNGGYIGGIAALVGHIWPLYYGFKGGKGAATSIGALVAVHPGIGIVFLALAAVGIGVIKVVSIISMSLALLLLLYALIFQIANTGLVIFAVIVFVLLMYCHRENVQRLINGEEFNRKIDFKKKHNRPDLK